jgi:hypothetical protein
VAGFDEYGVTALLTVKAPTGAGKTLVRLRHPKSLGVGPFRPGPQFPGW